MQREPHHVLTLFDPFFLPQRFGAHRVDLLSGLVATSGITLKLPAVAEGVLKQVSPKNNEIQFRFISDV